jgi:hypothetical protein
VFRAIKAATSGSYILRPRSVQPLSWAGHTPHHEGADIARGCHAIANGEVADQAFAAANVV